MTLLWWYYEWVLGEDTRNGLNLFDLFYLAVYYTGYALTKVLILWYTLT